MRGSRARSSGAGITTDRRWLVAALLVRGALELSRLGAHPDWFNDVEELLSARVGLFVLHTGAWGHLLDLQYKAFCGGCTVHALTATAVLGVGGESWLLWKGIALFWTLIQLPLGLYAMRALAPRPADLAFLALMALPPLGAVDLGLMAWGNHPETGAFVLGAIALLPRSVWASGLVAGLGIWFCRTGAYVVPLLLLLARRDVWKLAIGVAAGMLPILLPAARGEVGAYDVGLGLGLDWRRLSSLWSPHALGERLWPQLDHADAFAALWLGAAVLAMTTGRSPTWVLVGTFAAGFLLSTQAIPPHGGRVLNLRYHAPWLLVVPMVVAAAFGRPQRRAVASVALAAMLAANLVGQVRAFKVPTIPTLTLGDPRAFQSLAFRFQPEELTALHADNADWERIVRRMEGYAWAAAESRGESVPTLSGEVQAGYDEVKRRTPGVMLPPGMRR